MASQARARQRRWLWSVKVRKRRATRSKDLRRHLARHTSSLRPAWRPRLSSVILPKERSQTQERSAVCTRRVFACLHAPDARVHERLHRNDRVLLVGDRRQHEAVEAGRPFAQLQEAGMRTAKLDEIVRQRDPELKQASSSWHAVRLEPQSRVLTSRAACMK